MLPTLLKRCLDVSQNHPVGGEADVWLASSQQFLQLMIIDDVDWSAVFGDPLSEMGTVTMNIQDGY